MDNTPLLMNPILQVAAVTPWGRSGLRAGPLSVVFDAGDLSVGVSPINVGIPCNGRALRTVALPAYGFVQLNLSLAR